MKKRFGKIIFNIGFIILIIIVLIIILDVLKIISLSWLCKRILRCICLSIWFIGFIIKLISLKGDDDKTDNK